VSPHADAVAASLGPTVHEVGLLERTGAAESARERVRRTGIAVGRAAVLALVLGGWAFASGRLVDAEFLSDPRAVGAAFADLVASGRLFPHLGQTLLEVLSGYVIGVVLGMGLTVLVAAVEAAHRVLRPFLIAFYSIPKIALAPLFILWFGFGLESKIVISAALAFFPVFSNALVAFKSIEPGDRDVMVILQARPMQRFAMLELPTALPVILTGMEVAVVLAMIGAIVGEFIGGNEGLGFLAVSYLQNLAVPDLFAVIVLLTLLGLVLYAIIGRLRAWLTPWHVSTSSGG